jgi:hypothetical protein
MKCSQQPQSEQRPPHAVEAAVWAGEGRSKSQPFHYLLGVSKCLAGPCTHGSQVRVRYDGLVTSPGRRAWVSWAVKSTAFKPPPLVRVL